MPGCRRCLGDTPPKTNMEPEKEPLEEDIPMKNPSFFRFHVLVFGGVIEYHYEMSLGGF